MREGSGEASLRHCGRNLYLSGCGAGRLGGKPAYGTAVGIFPSLDGVGEGSEGSQPTALRYRNLSISGWGGGGLEGKAAYGTAVGFFFNISREEKRMQAQEKNIDRWMSSLALS